MKTDHSPLHSACSSDQDSISSSKSGVVVVESHTIGVTNASRPSDVDFDGEKQFEEPLKPTTSAAKTLNRDVIVNREREYDAPTQGIPPDEEKGDSPAETHADHTILDEDPPMKRNWLYALEILSRAPLTIT